MIPAIFVRQTNAIPYADAIVQGYKTIETRSRNMLGRFVGKRVFVIRTRSGDKPFIIGSVFISDAQYHSAQELDKMRNKTLIPPGSQFDCHGKGKWCYTLERPESTEIPIALEFFDIAHKNRSYAMLREEGD